MTKHDRAHNIAESKFKKRELQLLDGQKAMAEHEANRLALYAKTAKLRALRLARDAAEAAAAEAAAAAATPKAKPAARTAKTRSA